MLNQLLETIIQILLGWVDKFNSHAQHVEDKLDSLDQTASDIETNTEPISDIKDNTGAVITPIQNIKSNTDSIATSSQTSANNTTAILNNVSTLSTNTGRAAAFAEDCANNTLEIKDKITTIASDTTQLRTDSANIAADVSSINQAIGYYVANTLVTEDSEGALCSFDTDLEDYLQKAICTIPADLSGFSSLKITKSGKNLLNTSKTYTQSANAVVIGQDRAFTNYDMYLPAGTYSIRVNCSVIASVYYRLPDSSNTRIGATSVDLTFTLSAGTKLCFYVYTSGGVTISDITLFQLEVGSSVTPYEDYKEITNTVSLGSTITDGAEVDLLSGIVKINTSPVTYSSITPIAIRTYKGVNNIYSDIGSMSLTYRETLKHYLDKQDN